MANPRAQSSSRHVSRQSSVASHLGENVFSDENEIDGLGIADGYTPSFALQDVPSRSRRSSYQRSTTQNGISPAREPKKKPSAQEVSQPLISRNSFSLQHDAQYSDPPRRIASVASSSGQREPSTARPQSTLSRNSTFARPQSTYNGPSAPSHPYGMYPQNANDPARRTSVASSHRPTRERSFMGANRPTHPYGMYPQDTVSDNETNPLTASADIASVGFPGLGRQEFARRLSPTGDDADDIIGPDGHTEQLPPYTRYPEAGVYKPRTLTSVPLSPIPQEPSQTANSAYSINDTLLSPTSPTSMRDPILQSNRHSAIRARDRIGQSSRQKTCFGKMPLWMVILVILLMVTLGAVAGVVIGKFVLHGGHGRDGSDGSSSSPIPASAPESTTGGSSPASSGYSSISQMPGAAHPLPTSAGGPLSVPTGFYPIVVSATPKKSTSCLNSSSQARAWNCAHSMDFNINVVNPMTGPATVTLTNFYSSGALTYGDQTPDNVEGYIFGELVTDPDESSYGAAYYFNTTYNKRVILHSDFGTSGKRSVVEELEKRQNTPDGYAPIANNDQVWDCWWNETYIDGFIYIGEPASTTISVPSPAPTGNSKRHLSTIWAGKAAISPYTRKVKIREYRQQPSVPALCTRMQFVNNALQPSTQAPTTIALNETDPPSAPFSIAKLMSSQDWPKWKHRHKNKNRDKDKDQSQSSGQSDFCACIWDFN